MDETESESQRLAYWLNTGADLEDDDDTEIIEACERRTFERAITGRPKRAKMRKVRLKPIDCEHCPIGIMCAIPQAGWKAKVSCRNIWRRLAAYMRRS